MAVDTKAPGQAPPDLPSLLLDGRICYIGMAVRGGACVGGSRRQQKAGGRARAATRLGVGSSSGCSSSGCVGCGRGGSQASPLRAAPARLSWASPACPAALPLCGPPGLVQLVPAVTELVISELLWLNYAAPREAHLRIHKLHGCAG